MRHPFDRYTWLQIGEAKSLSALASIPVIDPMNEYRRETWSQVLEWYGLAECEAMLRGRSTCTSSDDNHILCLDEECAELAQWYAEVQGRQLHVLPADRVSEQYREWTEGSLLLIGRFEILSEEVIEHFCNTLQVRWGVITASDAPGISFMLAKQLAYSRVRATGSVGLIDAINGRLADATRQQSILARSSYEPATLEDWLDRDWHDLILHVHGEGGHGNLVHAVLCGRVGERETLLNGRQEVRGCFSKGDRDVCKRANNNMPVHLFSNVRAKRISLYSCNGYSTTGRHYPSNVSCASAITEGYGAMLLCNDRPKHSTVEMIDNGALHLTLGGGLGELCLAQNDRQQKIDGERPWILIGDPALATDQLEGPPRKSAGADVPAFPELAKLNLLLRRSNRCVDFEFTLSVIAQAKNSDSEGLRSGLKELRDCRIALEHSLRLALRWMHLNIRGGGTEKDREVVWRLAMSAVAEWDEALSKILADPETRVDIMDLAMGGLNLSYTQSGPSCPRCDAKCTEIVGESNAFLTRTVAYRCRICGPVETWSDADPLRLENCPAVINPGDELKARCNLGEEDLEFDGYSGFFGVNFRDKSTGETKINRLTKVSGNSCPVDLSLPFNLGFDLHTLQIFHVRNLVLRSARRRLACLPHDEGSE